MEQCTFIKKNNEQCKRYQRVGTLCKLHNTLTPVECSICYSDITKDQKKTLECGHVYHTACIYKWTEKQSTCPLCRKPIQLTLDITAISDMKKIGRGFRFLITYENSEDKVWISGKQIINYFKDKNSSISIQ